jgi:hypothetical protein
VATATTGFRSVIWVGEPDLPGRLQAERTAASERDIDRSLNIFNAASMSTMKSPGAGVKENQDYDQDRGNQPCGKFANRKHIMLDFLCQHMRAIN